MNELQYYHVNRCAYASISYICRVNLILFLHVYSFHLIFVYSGHLQPCVFPMNSIVIGYAYYNLYTNLTISFLLIVVNTLITLIEVCMAVILLTKNTIFL